MFGSAFEEGSFRGTAGGRDASEAFPESETSDSMEIKAPTSKSSTRGVLPRIPAATGAAGKEEAADYESTAAEAGAATGWEVFKLTRKYMLSTQGKVWYK